MKISFKDSNDKFSCQIFLDETFLGTVRLNAYKQKWFVEPEFKIPNNIITDLKNKFFGCSYEAGKKLIQLHRSWGYSTRDITFGVDLDEILSFLKLRR